ncbi:hypothetical protein AAFF_G00185870 [Aldrovandia affinis]|uniref:Uncharacterized protein n=1 Tax=Aldrovandia affinis TaxID=143900 RepID=A0AAD7RME9_9TELE|nr:hypothetical protein AAFF_G00185870 [Aldrovandia affinis]
MLSRKVPGSGLLSAAAGVDRGRVAERLRAALAGLQELNFLKEKQRNMVLWALRMNREESASSNNSSAENPEPEPEEQRLEATLAALKQQLGRLRRQDVGLRSHLQQLDLHISELKLDVCKVSSEHLETDSRPSSGFYDLSDGGSGSLSNSCTSVYSECLSPSQPSPPAPLPPRTWPAPSRPPRAPRDVPTSLGRREHRPGGVFAHDWGASGKRLDALWDLRRRPRSTETRLNRILTPVPGFYKPADGKKSSPCSIAGHSAVDPKYQSNLVSRSGAEVYRYPSPLHAVALQSPIFCLSGEGAAPTAGEAAGSRRCRGAENRPISYISQLLQRSLSKASVQGEAGTDQGQPPSESSMEAPTVITGGLGATCGLVLRTQDHTLHQHQVKTLCEHPLQPGGNSAPLHCSQDPVNSISLASIPNHEEVPRPYRCTHPATPRDPIPREVTAPSGQGTCAEEEGRKGDHALGRLLSHRRSRLGRSSSKEEERGPEGLPASTVHPQFVHAQFVPAGSQRVKVRQADRKTKAVRLRKRGAMKQQTLSEMEREADISTGLGTDRNPRQARIESASQRLNLSTGGGSGRSYSETSLYSSAFPPHPSQLPPQCDLPLRPRKAHKPHAQECPSGDPAKRKHVAWKWQSAVEMSMVCPSQSARDTQTQAAMRRAGMVHSLSSRPRSGQWVPPAPYPVQRSCYPPRSESEYSADCSSLFHSTIAESSEGEHSDFTTNRFGDSESSRDSRSTSDSDSSLSLEEDDEAEEEEEGGLVWAETTLGPTAAGLSLPQPRPEPPACRIKASRALKKKIRHFEPAALKVMTLVSQRFCLDLMASEPQAERGWVSPEGMSQDNGAVGSNCAARSGPKSDPTRGAPMLSSLRVPPVPCHSSALHQDIKGPREQMVPRAVSHHQVAQIRSENRSHQDVSEFHLRGYFSIGLWELGVVWAHHCSQPHHINRDRFGPGT